jgi:hypothetical protein
LGYTRSEIGPHCTAVTARFVKARMAFALPLARAIHSPIRQRGAPVPNGRLIGYSCEATSHWPLERQSPSCSWAAGSGGWEVGSNQARPSGSHGECSFRSIAIAAGVALSRLGFLGAARHWPTFVAWVAEAGAVRWCRPFWWPLGWRICWASVPHCRFSCSGWEQLRVGSRRKFVSDPGKLTRAATRR